MTVPQTLNSRLRVLIAKTFRAEKLYGSLRNPNTEKLAGTASLSEVANDIRAKEWQRSHYQLRVALNDILALGNNSIVAAEIGELKHRFEKRAEESSAAVENGVEALLETVKRHEFARVIKLSLELVRQKARVQVCKVVIDELTAALDSSGKSLQLESIALPAQPSRWSIEEEVEAATAAEQAPKPRSNVIPLRRRVVGAAGSER